MTTFTTEEKEQIALDFVNGQMHKVRAALIKDSNHLPVMDLIGRAFDVYQFIRGWYGSNKALEF